MTSKAKVAHVIRILSIPPIMITCLVGILYFTKRRIFINNSDIVAAIIFLGVMPVLAYPVQAVVPKFKEKGRDYQRKLAFVFNIVGYTLAFVYSLTFNTSGEFKVVCVTYFYSVIVLTLINVLFEVKASGHASSFTGPLLLLVYVVGVKCIIPCLIVATAVIWSSLELKRHTMKEIIAGIVVCLISFLMAIFIIG